MAQSNDRTSRRIITSHQELVAMRRDSSIEIRSYRLLTDTMAMICYRPVADKLQPYKNGNLFIVCQVTSIGRIMLLSKATELEEVKKCHSDIKLQKSFKKVLYRQDMPWRMGIQVSGSHHQLPRFVCVCVTILN